MVGTEQTQAPPNGRIRCPGIGQQGGNVIVTRGFLARRAFPGIEHLESRERPFKDLTRGGSRGQPLDQLQSILRQTLLANPLDRREPDCRVGILQELLYKSRASGRPDSLKIKSAPSR